jgi:Rrf2 family protein
MVSQTGRYALRLLGFLARQDGGLTSGEELAEATGVPANYLSKILNQLRKHGFVESRKGWGGGFRICKRALTRPIREVLVILDGVGKIDHKECVFGLPECDAEHPCPLHGYWEEIRTTFDRTLVEKSVGDLAVEG